MDLTPSQEHDLRRLEAFSDIVIGFSLAELGTSLAFTKHETLDVPGLLAFIGAFAIVCSLWFFHHRLFATVFVPSTWPVLLNFLWLAVVVVLVFVAQGFSKTGFINTSLDEWYFGLYAIAYGILAVQPRVCLRGRVDVSNGLHSKAIRQSIYMTLWTFVFLVDYLWLTILPANSLLGWMIDGTFLAGAIGSFILTRYFKSHAAAELA